MELGGLGLQRRVTLGGGRGRSLLRRSSGNGCPRHRHHGHGHPATLLPPLGRRTIRTHHGGSSGDSSQDIDDDFHRHFRLQADSSEDVLSSRAEDLAAHLSYAVSSAASHDGSTPSPPSSSSSSTNGFHSSTSSPVHHENFGGISDGDDGSSHMGSAAAAGRAVFEVLRINPEAQTRRLYVKRRDLLRAHNLQPRDLRRIDPSLGRVGKTIFSISIREGCILIALGGVRLIVAPDRALLFEPSATGSRKFLDIAIPHLQQQAGARILGGANGFRMTRSFDGGLDEEGGLPAGQRTEQPFELEMVEAALMVVTGALDTELWSVSNRVQAVLKKLPRDINPTNLEELRSVKAALVDIESKADTLREVLEDLVDDEDEMREMNLSSRPKREERRRQRERDKLEREREYEREREARRERALAEQQESSVREAQRGSGEGGNEVTVGASASNPVVSSGSEDRTWDDAWEKDKIEKWLEGEKLREVLGNVDHVEEAMMAAAEAQEEERELEQAEDMLDYYLQRAAMAEVEAQQLLNGARDLEESIGISLSARRLEVGRLELTLSIGSFAAALGAMIAGIFGMNLTSTLEASVIGFWGTTGAIVLGCFGLFKWLHHYAKKRRIL